jgi:GT2 family glycosyltransferase
LGDYSNIVFKKLDKNYGFSKAVNEGIKLAKSEFVILLNNDTAATPEWVDQLMGAISKDKKIFSVSSKMVQYYNKSLIDDAGDEYCILGQAVQRGHNEPVTRYMNEAEVFTACAGAAIYRKSIFDKIGYFDENFFAYMEDVDIGYRARVHGYKNMYCPMAVVYHMGSMTSKKQASTFTLNLISRNTMFLLYKNMPIIQLIINLPFLIIGYLLKCFYYHGDKERYCVYKKAVRDGIKQTRNISKIPLNLKNIFNYIIIELWLIRGLLYFIKDKIKR